MRFKLKYLILVLSIMFVSNMAQAQYNYGSNSGNSYGNTVNNNGTVNPSNYGNGNNNGSTGNYYVAPKSNNPSVRYDNFDDSGKSPQSNNPYNY